MFTLIMAGGSGTRFWPASKTSLPKQFLKIIGDKTMLAETVERVSPISKNVFVVVNKLHEQIASEQLEGFNTRVLVEPVGRNTAACIGLAAMHIKRRDENTPIIVLPADHYIANVEKFIQSLTAAAEVAQSGCIVTLGITPTRPETGYGYIKMGEPNSSSFSEPTFSVERFVEKPNQETALNYISEGSYLWNSGIFVFTAKTILSELNVCLPDLYKGLLKLDATIDTPEYEAALEQIYPELESISIDYGVMERTKSPIYVLKTDFGWSDVGSWQSLYELRSQSHDGDGNLSMGHALALDSSNNFIYSESGRTVTLLGVDNLVIVDTADAVLIAKMDRSQDVKKVIQCLKEEGRIHLC